MEVTVRVAPLPLIITFPGVRVSDQFPVEGNPLNATLPVERAHVGWVIVPTTGAVGVSGWALITTPDDEADTQPFAFVTVKV